MSEVRQGSVSPVSPTERDEINRLISYVEAEVPDVYRTVVLDYLLRLPVAVLRDFGSCLAA